MRQLFFHEESIHEVSRRYPEHEYIHTYVHTYTHTDKPKPICPPHFFKVGGIKTRAIWIGALSHSVEQLCRNQRLDWSQDPFKVLGVTFTTEVFDIWNINSNEIITKIENLCKQWAKRKLTLIGRITIIKSLALSKFTHLFLALPYPPEELIKKLNKIFYTFL